MKERKKFQRGIALFNAHKFFEAHEVWEELWLLEPEPDRIFLQGLIQLAAAFHHYSRGNSRGAESLLAAGIVKLGRFPGNHHGLALAKFRAAAKRWARMLGARTDPGLQKLPQIHSMRPAARRKQSRKKSGQRKSTRAPR
jgi:predicted metal-dependent hydrolase